jgi:hypothetical protein
MATTIYEHNFGFWEIDCPEERAFFEHVKAQSVGATCKRCDRLVWLMPTKTMCSRCVSALEYGAPTVMSKYGRARPKTVSGRERRRAFAPPPDKHDSDPCSTK